MQFPWNQNEFNFIWDENCINIWISNALVTTLSYVIYKFSFLPWEKSLEKFQTIMLKLCMMNNNINVSTDDRCNFVSCGSEL